MHITSLDHGPLISSGFKTFCQRGIHWDSGLHAERHFESQTISMPNASHFSAQVDDDYHAWAQSRQLQSSTTLYETISMILPHGPAVFYILTNTCKPCTQPLVGLAFGWLPNGGWNSSGSSDARPACISNVMVSATCLSFPTGVAHCYVNFFICMHAVS